jgi:arylsulfatase A-like enzyme
MRAVYLLFDSLNRKIIAPYGGVRVPTPNFARLASRCAVFDKHYVGSLPCMPARRDMQTGRLSFLHRSWGPLEPFDNSFPVELGRAGIYSHLTTDHYHYFEDGGATYHNRYSSFDFIRGQECDAWKAMVQPQWERLREKYHEIQFGDKHRNIFAQNIANRTLIREDADFPSAQCFKRGFDFLDENRHADNWFLQLETFDPHEPFHAPARFRDAYPTNWNGPVLDWPRYARVEELPEECEELRANYYRTIAHCDYLLGTFLDYFDAHDLWKNTALILTTDHGFLLGEHDFWAKTRQTLYEEIAHIPLFVYHPEKASGGQRRQALTQNIDIAPTILDIFGVKPPAETQGKSLLPLLDGDAPHRDSAIFGYFGGAINVTDGRFTYHRYPADLSTQELYQYTLMPTHIKSMFTTDELAATELAPPQAFTKGVPTLKIPVSERSPIHDDYGPGALLENETRLYDLETDPGQQTPLHDDAIEQKMTALMLQLMRENDAPPEAFRRIDV